MRRSCLLYDSQTQNDWNEAEWGPFIRAARYSRLVGNYCRVWFPHEFGHLWSLQLPSFSTLRIIVVIAFCCYCCRCLLIAASLAARRAAPPLPLRALQLSLLLPHRRFFHRHTLRLWLCAARIYLPLPIFSTGRRYTFVRVAFASIDCFCVHVSFRSMCVCRSLLLWLCQFRTLDTVDGTHSERVLNKNRIYVIPLLLSLSLSFFFVPRFLFLSVLFFTLCIVLALLVSAFCLIFVNWSWPCITHGQIKNVYPKRQSKRAAYTIY